MAGACVSICANDPSYLPHIGKSSTFTKSWETSISTPLVQSTSRTSTPSNMRPTGEESVAPCSMPAISPTVIAPHSSNGLSLFQNSRPSPRGRGGYFYPLCSGAPIKPHFLYLRPDPHGHGSLRPILSPSLSRGAAGRFPPAVSITCDGRS